ncbi:hypothetical protein BRYFOR_09286 [Marvinbryantia formatexigens DSM 14469]|uniref:Uncharacterized protein n=1 Tax=Marvinbryantia formatexigens DSM 14469 TaxID=478749 RepID=C6LKT8_9FIRM|nr:hypothetical protein BRYFOR_09286 [Marvinbryantia formatexigens DSM 14469]
MDFFPVHICFVSPFLHSLSSIIFISINGKRDGYSITFSAIY